MKSKIRFENVSKKYQDKLILNNLSFDIEEGEFICIIGPSGCGKTTLLKLINRMEDITSGSIYKDNIDIKELNVIKLRRNMGYSMQTATLFPHMNIKENILYVPSLEKKQNEIDLKNLLKIVNLDSSILNSFPDEISGGQAQRVSIARTLAIKPDILLMDEPFSAVDEITRHNLQKEIKKIHNELNVNIIFITHDVKEAMFLGDRVMVLNKGNIEQFDTPKNIKTHPKTEFIKKLINIKGENNNE